MKESERPLVGPHSTQSQRQLREEERERGGREGEEGWK